MQNDFTINFELKASVVEELQVFSKLLKKDPNTILNEALEQYFENEQKKLLEKNINDENAMTNLDFDEFWDGVEI
jgi:predicted transcriptional regulator